MMYLYRLKRSIYMSNDIIVKCNSLVESSYHLSANEQRLILAMIACIPKQTAISDIEPIIYIPKRLFVALGINQKTMRREIYTALSKLTDTTTYKRFAYITEENKTTLIPWISSYRDYDPNIDGLDCDYIDDIYIVVKLSRELKDFVVNVKSNFTIYPLADVAGFSSLYSYRFYELMMRYKNLGSFKIGIGRLKDRLCITDKHTSFRNFKKCVVDVALNEINAKSPYVVECHFGKIKNKNAYMEFTYRRKNQDSGDNSKQGTRDPNTLDMLSPIKMTDKQREVYAAKLAKLPELGSNAPMGMSMQEYENLIANELLDANKAIFYRPYLTKVGFVEHP